ncbi:MAG: lysophospholipid acyltransferase family protein [Acidiphilium sp.]
MLLVGSLLFHLFIVASAVVVGLWAHVLRRFAPDRLLPLGQGWSRVAIGVLRLLCGIAVRVEGKENIPPGAVILAAQHQSAFDTLLWFAELEQPAYVMKRELLNLPILGPLLLPAKQIALDRAGGATALRKLVADVQVAAAAGRQIVIFPEGTRVAPGARVELQPGIVSIARATGLPVVPVATDSGRCWGRDTIRKRPGTIHVRIFPPLPDGLDRAGMLAALAHAFYERGAVDKVVGS